MRNMLFLTLAVLLCCCKKFITTDLKTIQVPATVAEISNSSTLLDISTIAGSDAGYQDGLGKLPKFFDPLDVAIKSNGDIIVADSRNNCIRKISGGVVSTIAGTNVAGYQDGAAADALFNNPQGLAIDLAGNIFVADAGNNCIRKISATGTVTTLAGNGTQGDATGTGSSARFYAPMGLAFYLHGNLLVADQNNNKIKMVTPSGVVTTIAGSGTQGFQDGTATLAKFYFPAGIAVDADNNILVADLMNYRIRQIAASTYTVSTLAGNGVYGNLDGAPLSAQFNGPRGLAIDGVGNIYVGEDLGDVRKLSRLAHTVSTVAGSASSRGYLDGAALSAQFMQIEGLAIDAQNNIIIADYSNHCIRKLTTTTSQVSTVAGTGGIAYYQGGSLTGVIAKFNNPSHAVIDAYGNMFVSDQLNHKIRKITADGIVTTFAGSTQGFQDGQGTAAKFNYPSGMAFDGQGNLIVADQLNYRIRKITPAGLVSTIAGGTQGFADGAATSAKFDSPLGVCVDGQGNIFVGDWANYKIRKITPSGTVSTFAGSTQGYSNGSGTAAQFGSPGALSFDGQGNLIVADAFNNCIREVTQSGVVSTLAGSTTAGFVNGTATAARFAFPTDLCIDAAGNVLVADSDNNSVRKISSSGNVTTIAGASTAGYVDGTSAVARFNIPVGIAYDPNRKTLVVCDYNNQRIRKISGNW